MRVGFPLRRKRIYGGGRSRRSRPGTRRRRWPLCWVCHRRRSRCGSTRYAATDPGAALKAGKRGRRPGEQKALDPKQEARVRKAVLGKYPDQLALPGLVWTRPQVRQLVRNWFGIGLSLVTIGKYLRSWGLSPQKPIRRAYEQSPEAVARWLAEQYPAIQARAAKDKAIILWLDQTGLRSDSSVGKGWALAGQAPGRAEDRETVRDQRDGRDQQPGRVVLHLLPRLVHRPGVPGLPATSGPPPGPEDPPDRGPAPAAPPRQRPELARRTR